MSLCGIGIGAVAFKLGSTPVFENHLFGLKQTEMIIYCILMVAGFILMVHASQRFANHLGLLIGAFISVAWNRRKERKRKAAMFANATPISEARPTGWIPEAPTQFMPVAPVVNESVTPAFTLSPPS